MCFKKIIFSLFLWIALLFSAAPGIAQLEELDIRIYGFEEGLSHRNIFKIQQDTFGFLWFGTVNGLNKYDGYQFFSFGEQNTSNPLHDQFITDMIIGSDNRIWLAHPNFLDLFDPMAGTSRAIYANTQSDARGAEQTPGNLAIASRNCIWNTVFFEQEGSSVLQKICADGGVELQLPLPGKYEKHPILQVDGKVYVAAYENELWILNKDGEITDTYTFPYRGQELAQGRIVALQTDRQKRIFVLLSNGAIYVRRRGDSQFRLYGPSESLIGKGPVDDFLVEKTGDVWIAGRGVLWYGEAQTRKVYDINVLVQEVTRHRPTYRQIFKDESGVVWVASDFGAIKLVRTQKLFATWLNGGNNYCSSGFCSMRGMAEDEQGRLYFSYYNGIHRFDPESNMLEPLFPDNEFVMVPFGLTYYKGALFTGNGLRIELEPLRIKQLFDGGNRDTGVPLVDRQGRLWIGFENKLYQYDSEEKKVIPFQDKGGILDTLSAEISFLHEGRRSNYLWIGTQANGLFRLDPEEKSLIPFPYNANALERLSDRRILAIHEDGKGRLWLATDVGLIRLDLVNQGWKLYTMEDGLPNSFLNGLLPEGDSCLWISSDNGLLRMRIAEETFTPFFKEDGLPANEFNRISFHKATDGTMYFGGLNGVVSFKPGPAYVETKKKREGRMLFTSFSKYDGELDSLVSLHSGLDPAAGIQLSHKDRFFTIGFALAEYAKPREHVYSYMLEGFDKEWSLPTTVNMARYHNVPAGKYNFLVRAASGQDEWNSNLLVVPVVVEQAFYRSRWFILLSALIFLLLVYGIMRFRLYRIRKQKRVLEEQVRVRTIELEFEKQKSDDLLLNILPLETAEELKATGTARARRYEQVSVLFLDFKAFSKIAEKLSPEALVAELDFCFREIDSIIERYQLEKIKTIGDAYLCVGGLKDDSREAACRIVKAALDIQAFLERLAQQREQSDAPFFEARLGIHTGPVVAGIVGSKKFAYDIWGDTVNIASRVETNGKVGKVNISQSTYTLIKSNFHCAYRGKIPAKYKGEIDMYFVEGGK